MAVFDFPDSPTLNQTYTFAGVTWKWNGSVWKKQSELGATGQKGEKGNKGDKGDKGEKGQKGQKGIDGAFAGKGDKGDKGQKGDVEQAGIKGQKGAAGPPGTSIKGQKGQAGSPSSVAGPPGTSIKGQKGEPGDVQSKGNKGEPGDDNSTKGQKGEPGNNSFLTLTDTPSSYSGQTGKTVKVNSSGNGLEFTDLGSGVTGTIPSGGIILWSGSSSSIPSGWVLCNGSNGTPNLTSRFVVGAGGGYGVGSTGGSANAVLISHTHTQSGGSTNDDGGSHVPGSTSSHSGLSNISNTGIDANGTLKTDGSVSGTNANLPPYYALCYIMKT